MVNGAMALQVVPARLARTVEVPSALLGTLRARMVHRGWTFCQTGAGVSAHRPEWPAQLCVLVRAAEEETTAMLGLAMEFGSMPLRGERFRDIFNIDREELLRTYGSFRLLQQGSDGEWLNPVSHRSFRQGMVVGISRRTYLAVFDRSSDDTVALAESFATDANRFVETAAPIASLLQRMYQRTVLNSPPADVDLPATVRSSLAMPAVSADSAAAPYPWRR